MRKEDVVDFAALNDRHAGPASEHIGEGRCAQQQGTETSSASTSF